MDVLTASESQRRDTDGFLPLEGIVQRLIGVFEQPCRKQALHLTAAAGKVSCNPKPLIGLRERVSCSLPPGLAQSARRAKRKHRCDQCVQGDERTGSKDRR